MCDMDTTGENDTHTRGTLTATQYANCAKVVDMAAMRSRSNRPQGGATVLLQGRVPESVRDAARAAAGASRISIAAYLEALVLADAEQHFVRPAQEFRQEAISA
jgi:hypothetical protein